MMIMIMMMMKEVVWCFMYIKATKLTENYKTAYELWRERE
jgi:hypothetical protein